MTDDSLDDTQKNGPFKDMRITPSKEYKEMLAKSERPKDGGYCAKCDTVWCEPGRCNCKPLCRCHLMDNSCKLHHQSVGTQKSEGDKIDKSKMIEADKSYWSKYTPSVFEVEVWNAAIEAAASVAEINSAAEIRRLKK